MASGGDWLVIEELLERGDSDFVDRLRDIADAKKLATFAERWYSNRSTSARRLLLAYLERPLNAFRHEPLIKRLFKLAEAAGDDVVMARFLVSFDRSVRRVMRNRLHYERQFVKSQQLAQQVARAWTSQGYQSVSQVIQQGGGFGVFGTWTEPYITTPGGTTMPRGALREYHVWYLGRSKTIKAPDWVLTLNLDPRKFRGAELPPESMRRRLEQFRLFSLKTRRYLQRRAWRYFRNLGNAHPERYLAAITEALVLYQDADVESGLALLDNWGLVHALFHQSPMLEARPRGWLPAEGRSLSELAPAPAFSPLWEASPPALLELVKRGSCRPVRRWAMAMLSRDPARACAIGLEAIIQLLDHQDGEVVAWAAELLSLADNLSSLAADRWLKVARTAGVEALERLAELMARHVKPDQVSITDAARLAASRSLPLAKLGLNWLEIKHPASDDERRDLLVLLEAECQPLRPTILAWLRSKLSAAEEFRREWALAFLDCRHADARAEGMRWFQDLPAARDDVTLWQILLESPYDDVRLSLVAELEAMLSSARDSFELERLLDPDHLRLLWASVLLNVRRGSRVKPAAVDQVVWRLDRNPAEADQLVPLLSVALRSLRRPERHAALAALVRLVERRPEFALLVEQSFPELKWA